jgi:hypothetical protein
LGRDAGQRPTSHGGDLHQYGGLNGKVLDLIAARAAMAGAQAAA